MKFKFVAPLLLACMVMSLSIAAASDDSETDFNNTWALNGPYNLAGLKGKVVVVRFYESG